MLFSCMKQCQVPFPARGHFDPTWEEIAQLTLAVHQKNRCVFVQYVRANELVVSGLPNSFPSHLSLSSRKRGFDTSAAFRTHWLCTGWKTESPALLVTCCLCIVFSELDLHLHRAQAPLPSSPWPTHSLSHTTLSHTLFHTQLSHTPSFTHTLFHTQLCHTLTHTIFHTHSLSHTTLSHTLFHTQLSHTPSFTHTLFHTQLCHTLSFTHNFHTHHLSHTLSFTHNFSILHHLLCLSFLPRPATTFVAHYWKKLTWGFLVLSFCLQCYPCWTKNNQNVTKTTHIEQAGRGQFSCLAGRLIRISNPTSIGVRLEQLRVLFLVMLYQSTLADSGGFQLCKTFKAPRLRAMPSMEICSGFKSSGLGIKFFDVRRNLESLQTPRFCKVTVALLALWVGLISKVLCRKYAFWNREHHTRSWFFSKLVSTPLKITAAKQTLCN